MADRGLVVRAGAVEHAGQKRAQLARRAIPDAQLAAAGVFDFQVGRRRAGELLANARVRHLVEAEQEAACARRREVQRIQLVQRAEQVRAELAQELLALALGQLGAVIDELEEDLVGDGVARTRAAATREHLARQRGAEAVLEEPLVRSNQNTVQRYPRHRGL